MALTLARHCVHCFTALTLACHCVHCFTALLVSYLTIMHTLNLHIAILDDTTLVEVVGTLQELCY